MSEFVEKLTIDESQAVAALSNVKKLADEAGKGMDQLNKDSNKAGKEMSDGLTKGSEKSKKAISETNKEIVNQKNALLENVKSTKVFGVSINDITQKLTAVKNNLLGYKATLIGTSATITQQADATKKLTGAMILKEKAIKGVIVASKLLKIALISTGIGALVVALGSLIAFFTKTQKGADMLSRAGAALGITFKKIIDFASDLGEKMVKAFEDPKQALKDLGQLILDNLLNRFKAIPDFLGAIGKSLWNLVNGRLKEATKEAGNAGKAIIQGITGISKEQQKQIVDTLGTLGKEINKAVTEMDKLTQAKQRLRDASNEFIAKEAELNKILNQNREISRDESKSLEERMAAAIKADKIEQQITAEKLKLAKERYRIVKGENDLAKNMAKDYEDEYQALAEVHNVESESARRRVRMNSVLNGLIKEQKDLFEGMKNDIVELAKATNLISQPEQFEMIKQKQLETLTNYIQKLQEMGKALKIDVSKEVELATKLIEGLTERTFDKEIKPLKIRKLEIDIPEKSKDEIEQQLDEVGAKMKVTVEPKIGISEIEGADLWFDLLEGEINTFEELWDQVLTDMFGPETSKDIQEFMEGVGALLSELNSLANEATEIQLNALDKQLDRLSENRQRLEEELDAELELQKQGLANNVGNKKAEVDAIIAEEKRMNAEKEKLQKEAERRQLIADSVAQASSLITSSIQIIQGFSKIPVVGLGLGIAAVGALLAFFTKNKIDAFKATKLSTGAERIDDHFGFGDRYGNTDLAGGKGYRLINEASGRPTNVIISGREMLIPEAVSLQNQEFFSKLRAGAYNGINLAGAIEGKKYSGNTVIVNGTPTKQTPNRQFIKGKGNKYHLITIKPEMKDGTVIEFE